MTFILHAGNEHARLKTYSATVTGKTAVVKIAIEVTDTFELSFILRQLEELQAARSDRAKPRAGATNRQPSAKARGHKQLGQQVLLALPPPRFDIEGDS